MKLLTLIGGTVGAGLAIWLLARYGFGHVLALLEQAGWGILAVMGFHLIQMLFSALGWRTIAGRPCRGLAGRLRDAALGAGGGEQPAAGGPGRRRVRRGAPARPARRPAGRGRRRHGVRPHPGDADPDPVHDRGPRPAAAPARPQPGHRRGDRRRRRGAGGGPRLLRQPVVRPRPPDRARADEAGWHLRLGRHGRHAGSARPAARALPLARPRAAGDHLPVGVLAAGRRRGVPGAPLPGPRPRPGPGPGDREPGPGGEVGRLRGPGRARHLRGRLRRGRQPVRPAAHGLDRAGPDQAAARDRAGPAGPRRLAVARPALAQPGVPAAAGDAGPPVRQDPGRPVLRDAVLECGDAS